MGGAMRETQRLEVQAKRPGGYNIQRRGQIHTHQVPKSIARPDGMGEETEETKQERGRPAPSGNREIDRGEVIYADGARMVADIDKDWERAQKNSRRRARYRRPRCTR